MSFPLTRKILLISSETEEQKMGMIKYTVIIALALFLALLRWPESAFAGSDESEKAFHSGDYARALELLKPEAEEGNHGAQYYLGEMYWEGLGVNQNFEEAAKLFLRASERNSPYPQRRLGMIYESGRGLDKDLKLAYMWFDVASSLGDGPSAKRRDGVAKNLTPAQIAEAKKMAREWLSKHR